MRKTIVLCLATFTIGCMDIKQNDGIAYYYNLDSLVLNQQKVLVSSGVELNKRARIATDSSKSKFIPDSLAWSNELRVFNEANINKAVLLGLYQTRIRKDEKSNLKVKEFIPVEGEELKVSYLRIYYLDQIDNIRKLEAAYNEDNPLYHSGRVLKMTFEDIQGKAMLSRYTIRGSQKMILQDSITFDIEGEITH